jgi:hypothetical protein
MDQKYGFSRGFSLYQPGGDQSRPAGKITRIQVLFLALSIRQIPEGEFQRT